MSSLEKTKNSSCLMSRMALNDNKAGMEGLDKEKINQIIYNASKGSKFYENERKKEEQLNERVKEQQLLAKNISDEKLQEGIYQADLLLAKFIQHRDFNHFIVHVDMDAFYAAVEMRDDPTLKNKPMAVGGMGMLSTSNYLARKFGVRAAMPGFIGLKLCPDLVMVKQNFEKYTAVSREIRQVLAVYDPNFCPMSLDEAYLDFGPHMEYRSKSPPSARTFILRLPEESSETIAVESSGSNCHCDLNCVLLPAFLDLEVFSSNSSLEPDLQTFVNEFSSVCASEGIPKVCDECQNTFPSYCLKTYGVTIEDAVCEMRNRIEQRTFLTASAGIAPNMMLAKVCSDKNKPNGQYRIPMEVSAVEEFVGELSIRKISGVGKVTEKLLGALGVNKCSDIYQHRAILYHLFSPTSFQYFMRIFLGMGSTVVQRDDERKSMSTESTFSDTSDKDELCRKCEEMCESLAQDLKDEYLKGKTVTLKIKCVSFEVKTRSHTLQNATNDASVIYSTAKQLLMTEIKNALPAPLRLRLMGVRMSKLIGSEKTEVTVKEMFKKMATGSSSSCTQDRTLNNDLDKNLQMTGKELPCNETAENIEHDDCIIVSSSSTTQSSHMPFQGGISVNSTAKLSKRGLSSGSENITRFLTKETQNESHHHEERTSNSSNDAACMDQCDAYSPGNEVKTEGSKDFFERSNGDLDSSEAWMLPLDIHPKESSHSEVMTCPICGVRKMHWDLDSLNSHVDICLSQKTIKEILHHERGSSSNMASASISSSLAVSQSSNKRSRSETQTVNKEQEQRKKVQRTVTSFFQK